MCHLQSRFGGRIRALLFAAGVGTLVSACGTSSFYVSGASSGSVVPRDEMGNPIIIEPAVADARS